MASLETRKKSFLIRVAVGDKRMAITLGRIDRHNAERARTWLTEIEQTVARGLALSPQARQWLDSLDDQLHGRIAATGLVGGREVATAEKPKTLGDLVEQFFATSSVQPVSRAAYTQGTDCLLEYFGKKLPVSSIKVSQVDAFVAQLKKSGIAPATVSKRLRVCKRVLGTAVRWGWLAANPMADVKPGQQMNPERLSFIPQELVRKMMDQADPEWRVILALARFGGIRTPSETTKLCWQHVDFATGRLRIPSPKTAGQGKPFRITPMYPELRGPLQDLHDITAEGTEFVINRYRGGAVNLRTQALRIAARAGVVLPPKFFQNCRASRVTELHREFGSKCATDWAGHTAAIALNHYQMVLDADFTRAVQGPPPSTAGAPEPVSDVWQKGWQTTPDKQEFRQTPEQTLPGEKRKIPSKTGDSRRDVRDILWAVRDSNPQPPPCKGGALAN